MLETLIMLLKDSGLPVTYGSWGVGSVPSLPYLVVIENERNDDKADNHNYYKIQNFSIELYFERKDPTVEEMIESFFDDKKLSWSTDGDEYIDSEKMYQRIYYLTIGENEL